MKVVLGVEKSITGVASVLTRRHSVRTVERQDIWRRHATINKMEQIDKGGQVSREVVAVERGVEVEVELQGSLKDKRKRSQESLRSMSPKLTSETQGRRIRRSGYAKVEPIIT